MYRYGVIVDGAEVAAVEAGSPTDAIHKAWQIAQGAAFELKPKDQQSNNAMSAATSGHAMTPARAAQS